MAEATATRARHDGFSAERRKLFLAALRDGFSVLDACALVGVSNRTAYNHRNRDPAFARDWRLTLRLCTLPLELVAYERGVEGIAEPVYAYGKQVGTRVRRSDALLRTLLAGDQPEKYGRRAGLAADFAWLRGKVAARVAAEVAPLRAALDEARAELDALRAQVKPPPQIVNFVNPRDRRPAPAPANRGRERGHANSTAPSSAERRKFAFAPRSS